MKHSFFGSGVHSHFSDFPETDKLYFFKNPFKPNRVESENEDFKDRADKEGYKQFNVFNKQGEKVGQFARREKPERKPLKQLNNHARKINTPGKIGNGFQHLATTKEISKAFDWKTGELDPESGYSLVEIVDPAEVAKTAEIAAAEAEIKAEEQDLATEVKATVAKDPKKKGFFGRLFKKKKPIASPLQGPVPDPVKAPPVSAPKISKTETPEVVIPKATAAPIIESAPPVGFDHVNVEPVAAPPETDDDTPSILEDLGLEDNPEDLDQTPVEEGTRNGGFSVLSVATPDGNPDSPSPVEDIDGKDGSETAAAAFSKLKDAATDDNTDAEEDVEAAPPAPTVVPQENIDETVEELLEKEPEKIKQDHAKFSANMKVVQDVRAKEEAKTQDLIANFLGGFSTPENTETAKEADAEEDVEAAPPAPTVVPQENIDETVEETPPTALESVDELTNGTLFLEQFQDDISAIINAETDNGGASDSDLTTLAENLIEKAHKLKFDHSDPNPNPQRNKLTKKLIALTKGYQQAIEKGETPFLEDFLTVDNLLKKAQDEEVNE